MKKEVKCVWVKLNRVLCAVVFDDKLTNANVGCSNGLTVCVVKHLLLNQESRVEVFHVALA